MTDLQALWQDALNTDLWGNSVANWGIALAISLGGVLAFLVVRRVVIGRLRRLADKTSATWDDVVVAVLEKTSLPLFLFVAIDLGAKASLSLSERAEWVLDGLAKTAIFLQVGIWLMASIRRAVVRWEDASAAAGGQRTASAAILFLARLVVWSVVLLVVLSNLGVEIGALVAGLGVGGIAAALAVQSALGDLIAGFAIYADRPFDIGDFIVVDDVLGNVEKVGIRSTHLKSLGGERIVYPNGKLLGSVIRNYWRMEERRIVFHLGILYSTPADDIEAAPKIVRDLIESRDDTRFDRAHFSGFADSSLQLEVVYYVLSREYGQYMDAQHAINLGIVRRFQERGIGFAFPTRTLHLAGSQTIPVALDRGRDAAPVAE